MADTDEGGGNHFARKLLDQDERFLIESTCRHCGTVIVGSAHESLPQDEKKHVSTCLKARFAIARDQLGSYARRALHRLRPTQHDGKRIH